MSKYKEIKEQIKIIANSLDVDEALPPYTQLVKEFGVSDITIRHAISELVNEDIVYTRKGSGVFVAPKQKEWKDVFLINHSLNLNMLYLNGLYPYILEQMDDKFLMSDIELIYNFHKGEETLERYLIKKIIERNPYGVIVTPTGYLENKEYYKRLHNKVNNFVFFDICYNDINASYVCSDAYRDAINMANQVEYAKYDKIYVINDDYLSIDTPTKLRAKAYLEVLEKEKIKNYEYINLRIKHTQLTNYLIPYLNSELGKYKKVCMMFTNSSQLNSLLIKLKDKFDALEECKILSFEKVNVPFGKNINMIITNHNVSVLAQVISDLIKENNNKVEKIIVPGITQFIS